MKTLQDSTMDQPMSTPTSTDNRKSSKPIMEKRRRARINASLSELKSLLLEVLKKEGSRHSKMEKADILEMTVKHLRQIQRHQFAAAASTDPSVLNKYQVGFNECANEVTRYLSSIEGVDVEVRARVLNHLANSFNSTNVCNLVTQNGVVRNIQPSVTTTPVALAPKIPRTPEVNNNSTSANTIMTSPPISGTTTIVTTPPHVQVLPRVQSNGEVAFVIPGGVLPNGQVPSYVIPVYAGSLSSTPTPVTPTVITTTPISSIQRTPPQMIPSTLINNCNVMASPASTMTSPSSTSPSGSSAISSPSGSSTSGSPGSQGRSTPEKDDGSMWRPW